MTFQEALNQWAQDSAQHVALGLELPSVVSYMTEESKNDFNIAMDALPTSITSNNSGIPAFLTTLVDPEVIRIIFSPSKAAKIYGEVRKGNWLDETAMFPVIEHDGEVSTYDDFAENGRSGANVIFPQRQSYLFQTMKVYGERELERQGLAKLNWVSEIDTAAATIMGKFANLAYFFGVAGLQNYGLLNDPSLGAPLTPSTKAAGGVGWLKNGAPNATANEVYADIQSMFIQAQTQTGGNVESTDEITLAMSPTTEIALTITNSFGITVYDMLKKTYPSMTVETAVQYGVQTTANSQGLAAGNLVQMIIKSVEGQKSGYCAFNEKMRAHSIIKATSSFKQKITGGTWGAIVRLPMSIVGMLGV